MIKIRTAYTRIHVLITLIVKVFNFTAVICQHLLFPNPEVYEIFQHARAHLPAVMRLNDNYACKKSGRQIKSAE